MITIIIVYRDIVGDTGVSSIKSFELIEVADDLDVKDSTAALRSKHFHAAAVHQHNTARFETAHG